MRPPPVIQAQPRRQTPVGWPVILGSVALLIVVTGVGAGVDQVFVANASARRHVDPGSAVVCPTLAEARR